MKKIYQIKKTSKLGLSVFILAAALVLGIYACKKPNDGVNIIVDTGLLSRSPTLVHFINANPTSTTAMPTQFTVSITGPGAKYVQIDGGGTDFKTSNGYLPLSLTRAAEPSATNPITFNVYASVPGYAPISKTITIVKDTVSSSLVQMVEYANPVDGSSALVKATSLTGGTAPATVLKTNTTATLGQTATLSIPAGTQMLDASGAVINASTLSSSVIQYGTSNPASAFSTPGSLTATNAIGPNGTVLPGETNFVTAGMLAINMTADNTPVKKFSKPVQVSIDLPAGYINFNTGNAVVAGDVIPLWSQDEATGQWTYEGTATVSAGSGTLVATFSINHLSYWNLDYYYYYNPYYPQYWYNVCSQGVTFRFHPSTTNISGYYYLLWTTSNGNYIGAKYYYPQYEGSTVTTLRSPLLANTKMYVYDSSFKLVGSSSNITSWCGSTVDVNYTTPPPPDYVNITMDITAYCTNKQVVALPSGWFYIYDATTYQYYEIYVYNGTIYNYAYNGTSYVYSASSNTGKTNGVAKLINGHTYYFSTYIYGVTYTTGSFVLNKNNVTIPKANGLSGTATYNAATNSIKIAASFTITTCK
jgi:hypothetical protein